MIWIGTSGWQYDSWRGELYPPELTKDAWLPYFSARFPTVEVNNSFYRLPPRETFERWRERSAEGFLVTVKASRFLTHMKRLKDPEAPLELFWNNATGLGDKLGPVLFQLPPRFRADVPRLEAFLRALPAGIRPALEFRDPTWDTDEVLSLLDAHGAALVLPDKGGAGLARTPVTAGWSYVRFHQGTEAGSDYEHEVLERWAERIATLPARDVFVYFNNDPGGAAVRDARSLAAMLSDARGDVVPLAA